MTFSAMNTTDFRTLLLAPTVSRAAFFAYYLGSANELPEPPTPELQVPASQPDAPAAAPVAMEPVAMEPVAAQFGH